MCMALISFQFAREHTNIYRGYCAQHFIPFSGRSWPEEMALLHAECQAGRQIHLQPLLLACSLICQTDAYLAKVFHLSLPPHEIELSDHKSHNEWSLSAGTTFLCCGVGGLDVCNFNVWPWVVQDVEMWGCWGLVCQKTSDVDNQEARKGTQGPSFFCSVKGVIDL